MFTVTAQTLLAAHPRASHTRPAGALLQSAQPEAAQQVLLSVQTVLAASQRCRRRGRCMHPVSTAPRCHPQHAGRLKPVLQRQH